MVRVLCIDQLKKEAKHKHKTLQFVDKVIPNAVVLVAVDVVIVVDSQPA